MNKTDFHLCGTCGTHLFLTGKFRIRRFFLLLAPAFLAVMVLTLFVSNWLGGVTTEGPKKGGPNFGVWLFTVITIFSVIGAISGRREVVKSVKLEDSHIQ
ncbi:hypothetical protein [Leisingera aquimarina]|uniref:hypothetical protein n=1 Tax=Leisingera aquimarina TaxID=476529 RepID=UPI0012EBCFDD|nr:hypothetical protein [Leisingera aquimarina]